MKSVTSLTEGSLTVNLYGYSAVIFSWSNSLNKNSNLGVKRPFYAFFFIHQYMKKTLGDGDSSF